MVLSRLATVDILGEILYAIVFANIVVVLVSYGLDNLVVREISQKHYGPVEIAVNLLVAKVLLSLVVILLVLLYGKVVPIPLENPSELWFYVGAALLNSFINSISALRRGGNDFVTEMKVSLFRSATFFVLVLVAVYLWGASTQLVGQVRLIGRLLSLAFAVTVLVRELGKDGIDRIVQRPQLASVKMLLVVGFPFALQAILGTAYFQTDILVLGAIRSSSEVAYYQAAMQIVVGVMLVPSAIIQAYFPELAHKFSVTRSMGIASMKQMLGILVTVGSCLTLAIGFGAPFLIPVLFGAKMQPGVAAMQILSLIFVLRSVAGGLGVSLISIGHQRVLALAGFVAVVGSVGLNLLLVPKGGFISAAWVSLTTNLIVLAVYAVWWKRMPAKTAEAPQVQVT
jgi:O-antigen/teichoic acid export membrane protein